MVFSTAILVLFLFFVASAHAQQFEVTIDVRFDASGSGGTFLIGGVDLRAAGYDFVLVSFLIEPSGVADEYTIVSEATVDAGTFIGATPPPISFTTTFLQAAALTLTAGVDARLDLRVPGGEFYSVFPNSPIVKQVLRVIIHRYRCHWWCRKCLSGNNGFCQRWILRITGSQRSNDLGRRSLFRIRSVVNSRRCQQRNHVGCDVFVGK